jgi:hypothetical protein
VHGRRVKLSVSCVSVVTLIMLYSLIQGIFIVANCTVLGRNRMRSVSRAKFRQWFPGVSVFSKSSMSES